VYLAVIKARFGTKRPRSERQVKPVALEPKLVPVGVQVPDFTLPNAMGGDITLSDYRGLACVVLVFLRGFM
jgi:peroxiredoxin